MKEGDIEKELINKLIDLKYRYRSDIDNRALLEKNFRDQFESLNRVRLTDNEFERLLEQVITADTYKASQLLRENNYFERDDGTPFHYTLVNIKDWCKNTFEVINQVRLNTDYTHHVYDVVLLINGIPVVQIELKNQQISPSRAMEQIIEYKSDIGNGYTRTLMCFLQIFIVSNQHDTWYFANNNQRHFSFDAETRFLPLYQFADKDNKKITHLETFTEKFLAKCTLGQMISRYMVLVDSEQKLMIMRPYQIYAVKAIMDCVHTNCGNGYIWHTTGSGKTLTSFKTSTLLKENPEIEKCLFVVDRKDLDKQTVEEFNRFQEGCVTRNTHTEDLVSRLLSDDYSNKVIVTTIQKLGLALSGSNKKNYKKQLEPLRHKRIVLIFDECHRSQFGDNQAAIKEFFPNAQLFGFTGTPIFEQNSSTYKIEGEKKTLKTTKDVFERLLHAYTITHAIEDRNVLKFHLDYYKPKGKNPPQPGQAITKKAIINSIFEKHDAATASRKFNAILVTAGIDDAIEYFELFKNLQEARLTTHPEFKPLNIACVFTPPAEGNKDVRQMQEDLDQERRDNTVEPEKKKQALIQIIEDYNAKYGTNHKITEFTQYYSDVQSRVKSQEFPNRDLPHNQKIDILIVVEMLLTGFNAPFLNTLYVDRNLTYHRLIQAFSRTNRVINDTKPYGNILDFRQQQDAVSDAIALFSGESSPEVVKKIWLVDPAETVIETLDDSVKKLAEFMESQGLENKPSDVPNLKGEAARSQFINLFKEVQRAKTQLDQYTDLNEKQKQTINTLLPKDQLQGFRGAYLEVAERLRSDHGKKGKDASSEVEDLDFEFVLFASELIDYDYIMKLIARYSKGTRSKQKLTRNELIGLIRSDSKFMNDVDDIEAYINTLKVGEGLTEKQIHEGYETFKKNKHQNEIAILAKHNKLEPAALQGFVDTILRRKVFDDEELTHLLSPLGLGWRERTKKKLSLMEELIPLLKKYSNGREISGLNTYE